MSFGGTESTFYVVLWRGGGLSSQLTILTAFRETLVELLYINKESITSSKQLFQYLTYIIRELCCQQQRQALNTRKKLVVYLYLIVLLFAADSITLV